METLSTWFSTLGIIFAIIDPFGYVPIFLSMTAKDSPEKCNWILTRACLAAFVVLTVFTFVGNHVLSFFGISLPALQISGGLILLVIGFDMLRVLPSSTKISPDEESEATEKEDISIVPLAVPMLAGPASLTTVVVLATSDKSPTSYSAIIVSIFITLAFTYVILRYAKRIYKSIGVSGLHVVTRIMGLLLCAMAMQFVIDGYQAIR